MLTQKDQKIIRSKLDNIYKILLSKKDIDYFENEIIKIIKNFNKKNPKKKKIISAKELKQIVDQVLKTNQKTILLVVYNSQNQRRYIGVKLK